MPRERRAAYTIGRRMQYASKKSADFQAVLYPLTYDIDDSLKSEDLKGGKRERMII